MTTTYLQVTLAIWGFLMATVIGVGIHTVTTSRRRRAFTAHTIDALALTRECWPEPETDDSVTRCQCGVLWTADRTCPHGAKGDRS